MPFALPIAFDQRLVLYPQGQPAEEARRSHCTQMVLWCGGDVGRVIDSPISTLDAFAAYLERMRGLLDGNLQAMVVLTRTNPLALTVVDLRRKLEGRIPALRSARWIIYLDQDQDPFFATMALRLGHLTGDLHEAPVWVGPLDSPYLVLTSRIRDRGLICAGLKELDEALLSGSGERSTPVVRRR